MSGSYLGRLLVPSLGPDQQVVIFPYLKAARDAIGKEFSDISEKNRTADRQPAFIGRTG